MAGVFNQLLKLVISVEVGGVEENLDFLPEPLAQRDFEIVPETAYPADLVVIEACIAYEDVVLETGNIGHWETDAWRSGAPRGCHNYNRAPGCATSKQGGGKQGI